MITDVSICNDALLSLGQETIVSLTDAADPQAVKLNSIFAVRLKFLLGQKVDQHTGGWGFARDRQELTRVYKITLDTAPVPAAFAVGATLTGATSGAVCTVKKKQSSTVYWVTAPSVDFTDGEIISDGTNSVDCAAGYPAVDMTPPAFGSWQYVYAMPDDYLTNFKLVDLGSDKIIYPHHREGQLFFANVARGYVCYTADITDVTLLPGWFANLLSADLAQRLCAKFVSATDQYAALRADKHLKEAWMDALTGNGGDSYFTAAGGEAAGNTLSYEGFRNSDL